MLGGDIKFINEPGMGTQYHILIKQKIINSKKIGNIFEATNDNILDNKKLVDCTGKNVLVVDDNMINIKLAKRLLEQFNFTVDFVTSGVKCIEKVKTKKYDMIFLDHMMPEMDGIATMNALKNSGYSIPPVVALTANSYSGLREKYLEAGFSDYLSKPINFRELNKLMNKYFNNK